MQQPQPQVALDTLTRIVDRAIERRLSILHDQCEVLANDMQSAMYRIDTRRALVNLADVRVGTYHRYSTELAALQWFKEVAEPGTPMNPGDILRLVQMALEQNIETLRKQYERVCRAMATALQSIADDESWADIRTAAWYKASTEGRVFQWLVNSLAAIERGQDPVDLDETDDL